MTDTTDRPLAPDHPLMGMLDEYAIAHARRDYQAEQTARAALTAELAKYVADAERLDRLEVMRGKLGRSGYIVLHTRANESIREHIDSLADRVAARATTPEETPDHER